MGHCHRLLSLCHAGTMLPAALTAPLGPPPHGYFYPPPQPCFSLSYFKRRSWRTGNPVPGSQGPHTASLPTHAARAQGAMPREAGEGRLGSGLGAGGGLGTLGGTGWHKAVGLGWKQRPNAALCCRGCRQRCLPGEEGGPGGLQAQGSRVWGGGQVPGWHSPLHQTYRTSHDPRQGGADAGEMGVPMGQSPAKGRDLGRVRQDPGHQLRPPSPDACQPGWRRAPPRRQRHGATLPCDTPLTPGGIGSGHSATLPCSAAGTAPGPCPLLKNAQTPPKKAFSSTPVQVWLLP